MLNDTRLIPTKMEIFDKDGNKFQFSGDITIQDNSFDYVESPYFDDERSVIMKRPPTATLEIKEFKPLTRKKYIKLLMSKGIGIAGATEIARYIHRTKGKYDVSDLFFW